MKLNFRPEKNGREKKPVESGTPAQSAESAPAGSPEQADTRPAEAGKDFTHPTPAPKAIPKPDWYSQNAAISKNQASIAREKYLLSRSVSVETAVLLKRIPSDLLGKGAHDSQKRVHFKLGELAPYIMRQKPHVPLALIAKACPELFARQISIEMDGLIFFPWHEILDAVGLYIAHCDKMGWVAVPPPPKETTETRPNHNLNPEERPEKSNSQAGLETVPFSQPAETTPSTPVGHEARPAPDPESLPATASSPEESELVKTLRAERDAALIARDEAVKAMEEIIKELDLVESALFHTTEALEAVCKGGQKGSKAS